MKIGAISDTHSESESIIRAIILDLKKRGAEIIVHSGDIEAQHIKSDLFCGLPVVCALTRQQRFDARFEFPPSNWRYTRSGYTDERIVNLGPFKIYVGHERSMEVFRDNKKMAEFLAEINNVCDGVRYIFTGHTHHQFLVQRGLVTWINPGAICDGFNGHEYALVDTDARQVVFTRTPKTKLVKASETMGVLSDTGNISQCDEFFWRQAAQEFGERGVSTIIHCGNISREDIGRPEFAKFDVYYNLQGEKAPEALASNWRLIDPKEPIIELCGHRFYIQYDLGIDLDNSSEYQASELVKSVASKFSRVDFVLCGLIASPVCEEQAGTTIINPGDARINRHFVTIALPPKEITLGTVRLNGNK